MTLMDLLSKPGVTEEREYLVDVRFDAVNGVLIRVYRTLVHEDGRLVKVGPEVIR